MKKSHKRTKTFSSTYKKTLKLISKWDHLIISVNNLNNWLLGIPTTVLILFLANYNNFLIDGLLFKKYIYGLVVMYNFLIVLFFGFFKLQYEQSIIETERIRMLFKSLTEDEDEKLTNFINRITKECEDKNFNTPEEVRAYVNNNKDEINDITKEAGDEIFKYIRSLTKVKTRMLRYSNYYLRFYSLSWSPLIFVMAYIIKFIYTSN